MLSFATCIETYGGPSKARPAMCGLYAGVWSHVDAKKFSTVSGVIGFHVVQGSLYSCINVAQCENGSADTNLQPIEKVCSCTNKCMVWDLCLHAFALCAVMRGDHLFPDCMHTKLPHSASA